MEVTKDSIGKAVWLVPIGNNVKRDGSSALSQAREAVITKLARVKGEFAFTGGKYNYQQQFSISCYSKSSIKQGDNSGYDVYGSLEEVNLMEKEGKIRDHLRDQWASMPSGVIHKIGALLNTEEKQ